MDLLGAEEMKHILRTLTSSVASLYGTQGLQPALDDIVCRPVDQSTLAGAFDPIATHLRHVSRDNIGRHNKRLQTMKRLWTHAEEPNIN